MWLGGCCIAPSWVWFGDSGSRLLWGCFQISVPGSVLLGACSLWPVPYGKNLWYLVSFEGEGQAVGVVMVLLIHFLGRGSRGLDLLWVRIIIGLGPCSLAMALLVGRLGPCSS